MDNTEELGISFCAGYAGIERGLELAGLKHRTVAYVEIEAFAIANLVAKMEQGLLVPAPVWTNLKTFNAEAFRGIDFITAGYPCQPFSCAGQRKGKDDPRHLWPHLRRIYQTIRPRWMLFENVEGHVTLGLSTVISDLEEDGYKVEAGLFTAAEVGAPHRRKRVFILASLVNTQSRSNGQQPTKQQGRDTTWRSGEEGIGMENVISLGRGGRSEGGDEIRGCGVSEDKIAGSGASSEVLGNASSVRLCGLREVGGEVSADQNREERRVYEFAGASPLSGDGPQEGVADTERVRPEREWKERQGMAPARLLDREAGNRWPARPGQPQYDWEEPRVVESGMGRAVDGPSSRVDRLRLLGNGVVPQQAAKAYKTLNRRLIIADL